MYKPLKIQNYLRNKGKINGLREDPYNLRVNADSNKRRILFRYSQIDSDLSLQIVKEARGLILDRENNWEVISFPFLKFFNYGEEQASNIDWKNAQVFSKMDGTCSILYFFEGEWVMHTLGTVEGRGPVHVDDHLSVPFDGTFSDLFFYTWNEVYGKDKLNDLNTNYIYVFELMTPYNIVVKKHKEYKLSLLAVRNRTTLNELPISNFEDEFHTPDRFNFSNPDIDTLKSNLEEFPPDEEGYVVCDKNFNRVKIKNPDYVARHKMKDVAVNKKNGVLEIVLEEKGDDFLSTFPDLEDDIKNIRSKISRLVDYLEEKYKKYGGKDVDPDNHQERKDFALSIKTHISPTLRGFMFEKLSTDKNFEEIIKSSKVNKVSQSLRVIE